VRKVFKEGIYPPIDSYCLHHIKQQVVLRVRSLWSRFNHWNG